MSGQDPIEILMDEHELALKELRRLKNAVEQISVIGLTRELLGEVRSALRFIDQDVRDHNEKEERFLFPLLEQYVSGPPSVMRSEHRDLWGSLADLTGLIDDLEHHGDREDKLKKSIDLALYVVDLLSAHIAKENNVLFPMAKSMLTTDEYDVLRMSMCSRQP